jgi:prepilin-type processing-associated H-X9-DG protein
MSCLVNQKQIGLSMITYGDAHKDVWPIVYIQNSSTSVRWNREFIYPWLYQKSANAWDNTKLFGTVFNCQASKSLGDLLSNDPTNSLLYGYGMNGALNDTALNFYKKPNDVFTPAKAYLTMDSNSPIAVHYAPTRDDWIKVAGRHGQAINVLHCDGHAITIPVSEMPHSSTGTPALVTSNWKALQ